MPLYASVDLHSNNSYVAVTNEKDKVIKEKRLPDFTDALALDFGFASVEDFNEKTKVRFFEQKSRETKRKLNQEILEKMVAENSFEIPQVLLLKQEEMVKSELENTLKQQGYNDKMLEEYYAKWNSDIKAKAAFQVKSGILLDKLAHHFGIEISDGQLDAKFKEMAKISGVNVEEIRQYYASNEEIRKNLLYSIREEKTFERLVDSVQVVEEGISA